MPQACIINTELEKKIVFWRGGGGGGGHWQLYRGIGAGGAPAAAPPPPQYLTSNITLYCNPHIMLTSEPICVILSEEVANSSATKTWKVRIESGSDMSIMWGVTEVKSYAWQWEFHSPRNSKFFKVVYSWLFCAGFATHCPPQHESFLVHEEYKTLHYAYASWKRPKLL